jgi:hypothetical protein
MRDLVFEKKKALGKRNRNKDASVFVSISTKNKKSRFTFYNKWAEAIAKTKYVVMAVSDNRIYFKEATEMEGWFMSKTNYENTRVVSVQNEKIYKWIEDGGCGAYEFKHDDELGLYYIEKMKFEIKKK